MKVLAIMGSPRRNGTGTKVVEEIELALNRMGPVQVERLHLVDADLKSCRGCFTCIRAGEGLCPIKDNRTMIEEKIDGADGIILVSPGYVQNVSALMKNFMDRMAYTNHRPRFYGKKVMIVANGGAGLKKTLDALRIALGGPEVVSELAYLQLPWPISPRALAKRSARLQREAARFYRVLEKKVMRPSFSEYMRFRFFKNASLETKEWLPADYEFYKDKGDFYYDVKVGARLKVTSALLMSITKPLMREMAPWPGEMPSEEDKGLGR
ncbi:MAG: flavodoxin family protein [Methanomassiliicoccus sp.]|nr:flavodoxin family protein [Methanomassiliicoccus sp.]